MADRKQFIEDRLAGRRRDLAGCAAPMASVARQGGRGCNSFRSAAIQASQSAEA